MILPTAIQPHVVPRYMYWSDWGSTPSAKIERAGMDGSNRSVVIPSHLMWPNALAIDEDQGLLIWGDAQTEVTHRSMFVSFTLNVPGFVLYCFLKQKH